MPDADKLAAYATLYECLVTLTKLLAPVMPFITERMYQNLVRSLSPDARESVHLADYPVADAALIDESLSQATRMIMRLSSMGRAVRSRAGLKVRQPLQTLRVLVGSESEKTTVETLAAQLRDELNVKDVQVVCATAHDGMGEIDFWDWKVSPNMRALGPKYGRRMREITDALAALDARQVVADLRAHRKIVIPSADAELPPIELGASAEDYARLFANTPSAAAHLADADTDEATAAGLFDILEEKSAPDGFAAEEGQHYSVALSTEITPELRLEGQAREVVHHIQNMRRAADFEISDHIVAFYQGDALDPVIAAHADYIRQETLSRDLLKQSPADGAHTEPLNVDGIATTIGVMRE